MNNSDAEGVFVLNAYFLKNIVIFLKSTGYTIVSARNCV